MALKRGDGLDEFRELVANAATIATTWHVGSEYIWLDHALERHLKASRHGPGWSIV